METEVEEERSYFMSTTTAQSLINQYISLPLEKRSSISQDFWIKHQSLLNPLFKIAAKYSIIPVTSIPAERVFSKTGEIMSAKRNRLDPKNMDIIIF